MPRTEARDRTRLLPLALALLALAVAPALAAESSSADPEAVEPVLAGPTEDGEAPLAPRNLRIAGSALKPRTNNVDYNVAGGGGCTYATAGSTTTVWNTPLYLPDGATVTTLRVYYNDTSASNLTAWFTVYDLYGTIVDEWPASSTGTSGQGFQDSAAINHVINHGVYSYVVNYRPMATGTTLQFCGVRIFYDD